MNSQRGLSGWPRAAAPWDARRVRDLTHSPEVHVAGPAACGPKSPGLPGVDLRGRRPGQGGSR